MITTSYYISAFGIHYYAQKIDSSFKFVFRFFLKRNEVMLQRTIYSENKGGEEKVPLIHPLRQLTLN